MQKYELFSTWKVFLLKRLFGGAFFSAPRVQCCACNWNLSYDGVTVRDVFCVCLGRMMGTIRAPVPVYICKRRCNLWKINISRRWSRAGEAILCTIVNILGTPLAFLGFALSSSFVRLYSEEKTNKRLPKDEGKTCQRRGKKERKWRGRRGVDEGRMGGG